MSLRPHHKFTVRRRAGQVRWNELDPLLLLRQVMTKARGIRRGPLRLAAVANYLVARPSRKSCETAETKAREEAWTGVLPERISL